MPDQFNMALLVLRVAIGIVFIAHGIKHARGRRKTSNWFRSIGFKSPQFQWMASTATEIGVGALLVLGFLTSFATAGVIGVMFVAFWTVHRAAGFFVTARPEEGWEYVLILSVVAFAVAVMGPGGWSIDEGLGLATNLDGWIGAGLAGLGLLAGIGQVALFWRPASVAEPVTV